MTKWNTKTRTHLYESLKKIFGPYSGWGKTNYPKHNQAGYEKFKADFTVWFKQESGQEITIGAVASQVAWAVTHQKDIKEQGFVWNYILNKAAALDAGFIKSNNLPNSMQLEYPDADDLDTPQTDLRL